MKLDVTDLENGVTKVVLAGRMDIEGALAVDPQFNDIAENRSNVVVDMSGVDFLASLGMRTLVTSAKTLANKGGRLVLLSPQANVEKVLKTAGINTVIPIAPDLQSAIAHFSH